MLTVILHRVGEVPEEVHVYSVEEASAALVAFQGKHGMGASDMGAFHGGVYQGGNMLYVISYNGRVWKSTASSAYDGLVHDPHAN